MFALSLRNSLRPVNKLPPEIISQIARSSLESYHTDPKPIVPLTHVCQYWRESIVSTPENWTLISSSKLGLAALSLERSRAAPLYLQLDMSFLRPESEFRNLLTPHIQRTRTLRVEETATIKDLTNVLPNFPQSMPKLQSLDLAHTYDVVPVWDSLAAPLGSFPNTLASLDLHDIPLYPSFLELRTLKELGLHYYRISPALDSILNFVEDNRSLESVALTINSTNFPSNSSQRQVEIMNRLRRLSVACWDATTARTLISNIPLRTGAHLEITFHDEGVGLELDNVLSGIPMTHFPNLPSSTFMEYSCSNAAPFTRTIRLIGPNGSFLYDHDYSLGEPFAEFSVLPLTDIQELHLAHEDSLPRSFGPSSFPALKALILKWVTGLSRLFSALLPDPSVFPSLKTLGFLGCDITEEFMGELTRFASDRKVTTSAWLHRVVIIHQDGRFPSAASIRRLERDVSVVDVRFGTNLPTDLT